VKPTGKADLTMIDDHVKGVLYCVAGVVVLSPDSLLVKVLSTSLPIFTLIFYKYLIIFLVWLGGFLLLSHFYPNKTVRFKDLGKIEYMAGFVFGISNVLINYAFYAENVAYVLVILAINPAFASIFSHYLLHESTPPRTVVTCAICIGAVCYICSTSLSDGGGGSVPGILASLGAR
jgi:drug/metabolite transporter (DMT)-like permease